MTPNNKKKPQLLKKGYYLITVHDKKSFGFRTIIGYMGKDQVNKKIVSFHIGYTHTPDAIKNELLVMLTDEATYKQIPNREVELKIDKSGKKERYHRLYT
jgi:hypothetical protein